MGILYVWFGRVPLRRTYSSSMSLCVSCDVRSAARPGTVLAPASGTPQGRVEAHWLAGVHAGYATSG
eukprot:1925207-Pyramimonas_sp.AAC.1